MMGTKGVCFLKLWQTHLLQISQPVYLQNVNPQHGDTPILTHILSS